MGAPNTFFIDSTSSSVDPSSWEWYLVDAKPTDSTAIVCLTAAPSPRPQPKAPRRPQASDRSFLNILYPPPVQLAMGLLLVAVLSLLIWHALSTSTTTPQAEAKAPPDYPLDLNQASRDDLRLLPGIGDKLSQRIFDYRQKKGGFRNIEELRKVQGIGPVILDRLRPLVFVVTAPDPPPAPTPPKVPIDDRPTADTAPSMAMTSAKRDDVPQKLIDLNHADAAELRNLPGIGPKKSKSIVDNRNEKGPFRSIDDLRRVPGIGPKTIETLKPLVTVDGEGSSIAGPR